MTPTAIAPDDLRTSDSLPTTCLPEDWQPLDPADPSERSILIDLAYDEFVLRREQGEPVSIASFCRKHPLVAGSLERLLNAHEFLDCNPQLLSTVARDPWPKVGDQFGNFQLDELLGKGAFGHVFHARHTTLANRSVAIKITLQGTSEAGILARLEHPAVVPVYTAESDPQTGFSHIVMPYLGRRTLQHLLTAVRLAPGQYADSESLWQLIRDGSTLRAPAANYPRHSSKTNLFLWLSLRLAEGLDHVHSQGIYHGDLKPSNVLLRFDGQPCLLDFNLAFDFRRTHNRLGGTLPYMPPEQVRMLNSPGKKSPIADARSDVYALGILLYEMFAGRHPFLVGPKDVPSSMMPSVLLHLQESGAVGLGRLAPELDRDVADAIMRCLAFDPASRPDSLQPLLELLRRANSPTRRLVRWAWQHRQRLTLTAVMLTFPLASAIHAAATQPSQVVREEEQAVQLLRDGRSSDAIAHLTYVLERHSERTDLRLRRAAAYASTAEPILALADLGRCDQTSAEVRGLQAYCKAITGNFEAAIYDGDFAIQNGSESAAVYNNNAYCLYRLNHQQPLADQLLDRAIALDPELRAARYNRALRVLAACNASPQIHERGLEDIRFVLSRGKVTESNCYAAAMLFGSAATIDTPRYRSETIDALNRWLRCGADASRIPKNKLFAPFQSEIDYPSPHNQPKKPVQFENDRLAMPVLGFI